MIYLRSSGGCIDFGWFRLAWQNQDDQYEGFTAIVIGGYSLELGAIDQERQGIYLTHLKEGEVVSTRPLLLLP